MSRRSHRSRLVLIILAITLHWPSGVCKAADDVVDCPGKDEAFITTCSGTDNNLDNQADEMADYAQPTVINTVDFDDDDILNEVLGESDNQSSDDLKQDEETAYCDTALYDNTTPMQQLKANLNTLTERYYDPLPRNGKAAIGTSIGFIASRLTLGVANRLFRLAGAIWVISEMAYTSGFCEEAQCVPEEARPWIGILRRTLVHQCMKVRVWARKVYNQERIRELAQKDEFVASGFAAGALIGFVL